jgi:hypothetical protein
MDPIIITLVVVLCVCVIWTGVSYCYALIEAEQIQMKQIQMKQMYY